MTVTRSVFAKIHIAKKQLAMDEDSYRAMLRSVGGVDSSKDLTGRGAHMVLAHLERCGFAPIQSSGRKPKVAGARAAQLGKIEALLVDAGRSWDYLNGMVRRICKVDAIEFCDGENLGKLIVALQLDARRREAR